MVSETVGAPILFYDGACGLCSRAVRQCLAWGNEASALRFAPLQGETAAKLLPTELRTAPLESLVVYAEGEAWTEVEALSHLGKTLRSPFKQLIQWSCSPVFKPLTRWIYLRIAENRHRIFSDRCVVGSGARFLS